MFQVLTKNNFFNFRILLSCITLILLTFSFLTTVEAQRDEGKVAGVWIFDDGTANDTSPQNLNGIVVGKPESVNGIANKALEFNGTSDGIKIPDSPRINITNSFNNRTVAALFNCNDVSKNQKQVIYEEGGQTRGLAIYVFEGKLYVGDGAGTNIHYFGGIIDEVIVYNSAFDAEDFAEYAEVIKTATSVEPQGKYTTTWGTLKALRTGK